jgi:proline iminopeptidase
MLATDYALAHQEHLRSLVLASTIAEAALLRREMARLLEDFPAEIRETLRRHEEAGTTESAEYQDAIMAVYRVHLCRCDPVASRGREDVRGLRDGRLRPDVGPERVRLRRKPERLDRLDRLHEIRVPTLITVGRFDELTPACSEQIRSASPDS